jgi:nucleoprotein TPR
MQPQMSSAVTHLHEKERWESQLASLQNHANWLQSELQAKSDEYLQLQQQGRDKATQLELQLESYRNENSSLQTKVSVLQQLEASLQQTVASSSETVLALRQERAGMIEAHQTEILRTNELVEMQKRQIDEYQRRYQDAVRDKAELQKAAAEAFEESKKERAKLRDELEAQYKELLREQANEYQQKLSEAKVTPAVQQLTLLPGTAAASVDDDEEDDEDMEEDDGGSDNPVTITQLYTRYESVKKNLRRARLDAKQWKASFEHLREDIGKQAPLIVAQKEGYERLLDEVAAAHKRCGVLEADLATARAEAKGAREVAASHQRAAVDKARESEELAKQVQTLLARSVAARGGLGPAPSAVEEMQKQNQALIVDRRRLVDEIAELKNNLQEDQLRIQLDSVNAEIEELKREREEQEHYVVSIVQQRDMYRLLLQKHDAGILGSEGDELKSLDVAKQQADRAKKLEQRNTALETELAVAQHQAAAAARTKDEALERLARLEAHADQLTQAVTKLESDLVASRSQAARAEADADYHKEKCERLAETLQRARQEVEHVTRFKNELERSVSEMQQALSKLSTEASRLESEKQQAQMRLRLVETEAETAKAAEKRLLEEVGQLRADISRQGSFIDSIRRIESNLSAKDETEKEELKTRIQRLQEELEHEKSKIASAVEMANSRVLVLETRVESSDAASRKAQADATTAKEELAKVKGDFQVLESQLQAAKSKLGDAVEVDDSSPLSSLRAKVESLELELRATRAEKESLLERVDNYQKIARESEAALLDLKAATEREHGSQSEEVDALKSRLDFALKDSKAKEDVIRELTDQLGAQRGERQKLESELQSQINKLTSAAQQNEMEAETAKASVAAMKLDFENMKTDVAKMQDNYERELALHAQARTALRAAREEVQEATRRNQVLQAELSGLTSQLEQQLQIFEQEKQTLLESRKLLELSLKESREQNATLHTQLETLSDLTKKAQASRVDAYAEGQAGEVDDVQKVVAELREMVKSLRAENELIQLQLNNANTTAERERAASNVLKRSLDEARSELKLLQATKERLASSGDTGSELEELRAKLSSAEDRTKLLSDSNQLLRNESENLQKIQIVLREELETLRKSLRPAEEKQRELQLQIASLEAEKQSLTREADDWKNRVQSLVTKFNQVDPEEHEKLKTQVEELRKEKETLNAWKHATEEESTRIRNIAKSLNMKNREQQKTIQDLKKEVEKLTASAATMAVSPKPVKEIEDLKSKVGTLEAALATKASEMDSLAKLNDRMRERLRQFQATLKESQSKESRLSEVNAELKARADALAAELKKRLVAKSKDASPVPMESTPLPPTEMPAIEGTAKAAEQTEVQPKAITSKPRQLPAVPEGGFVFGPSEAAQPKSVPDSSPAASSPMKAPPAQPPAQPQPVAEKDAPADPGSRKSSLRVEAKAFVPTIPETVQAESAKANATVNVSSEVETPTSATPAESPSDRRGSIETKEHSMKQKLLERKRKLEAQQQLLEKRRKLEEAKNARKRVESTHASRSPAPESQAADQPATAEEKTVDTVPVPRQEKALEEAMEPSPATPRDSQKQGATEAAVEPSTTSVAPSDASAPSSNPPDIEVAIDLPTTNSVLDVASEPSSEPPAAEAVVQLTPMSTPPPAASVSSRKPLKDITPVPDASASDKSLESGPSIDIVVPVVVAGADSAPGFDVSHDVDAAADADTMEDEPVKERTSPHPLEEDDDAGADDAIEMDAAADAKDGEEEESMEEESAMKADAPFGAGAAFGSTPSWSSTPIAFGQPSSSLVGGVAPPTTFGFSKPAELGASGSSASFLNIKPPGSSTAPPVFSFGTTSSITLPTPSLPAPVAPSPFGAFASSTSTPTFGSFGSVAGGGAGPSTSMSLFGSPVFGGSAPIAAVALGSTDAADEGAEEMEDGEGDMDADA